MWRKSECGDPNEDVVEILNESDNDEGVEHADGLGVDQSNAAPDACADKSKDNLQHVRGPIHQVQMRTLSWPDNGVPKVISIQACDASASRNVTHQSLLV